MRVEWTSLAYSDLQNIFDHIAADNPTAASKVIASIRNAVRGQLAVSPYSGRPGRVGGTRELIVPRLPYIVAYRVIPGAIQILRVLHGARRWPEQL